MGDLRFIVLSIEDQQHLGAACKLDRQQMASGLERLLGMVMSFMLTARTSDALDLEYGTAIPGLLTAQDASGALDIFHLEADRCTSYFRAAQAAQDIPPEERLVSVTVSDSEEMPDWPGIRVTYLVQAAQGTAQFTVP